MTAFGPQTTIGFIGAGAVGGTLAAALAQAGYRVVAVASRTLASAQGLAHRLAGCTAYATAQQVVATCELVFISTPDDAIRPVASALSWRAGQGVVHCSGATSLDVFASPIAQGVLPGALHPFQAVASIDAGVTSLPGSTFGIEADGAMREALATMAHALGGRPIFLTAADKALYHLSAVMMGNLLTGLAAAVARPYVRGDVGTIRRHFETLRDQAPAVLPLYRELALAALPFAVEKHALSPAQSQAIRQLIAHSL